MGEGRARRAAHVFVPADLRASQPVHLPSEDFHHLARALRLRSGEVVSVSDGAGWSRAFTWTGAPWLQPAGEPAFEPRPLPEITVALALTKGAHPEWAVQKLTEVGVDRVILMTTARCVARWSPADAPRRLGRLREVARQAAMQSRRSWLPSVEGPLSFWDLVGGSPSSNPFLGGGPATPGELAGKGTGAPSELAGSSEPTAGLALATRGGAPLSLATPTVLVGPEGGWESDELSSVASHVALGPYVLRAETAALAAGVLLAALRAGVVSEVAGAVPPLAGGPRSDKSRRPRDGDEMNRGLEG